jgi:hypothetical protein
MVKKHNKDKIQTNKQTNKHTRGSEDEEDRRQGASIPLGRWLRMAECVIKVLQNRVLVSPPLFLSLSMLPI